MLPAKFDKTLLLKYYKTLILIVLVVLLTSFYIFNELKPKKTNSDLTKVSNFNSHNRSEVGEIYNAQKRDGPESVQITFLVRESLYTKALKDYGDVLVLPVALKTVNLELVLFSMPNSLIKVQTLNEAGYPDTFKDINLEEFRKKFSKGSLIRVDLLTNSAQRYISNPVCDEFCRDRISMNEVLYRNNLQLLSGELPNGSMIGPVNFIINLE